MNALAFISCLACVHFVNFSDAVVEDCRSLLFLPPISTRALEKHVIKSVNVTREDSCMVQCFGEKRCVSYNIGPIEDGFHQCELSDSDHVQDPQDMKDKPGFSYVTTKNPCNKSPCRKTNFTCLNGFTSKGYACVGPYKSLGCFRDDAGNRAIPFLEGLDPILDGSHSVRQDPISKCYEAATTRGYEVFAVQDGGLCAASAVAELTYGKHGPSDACGPEGEGGLMANHVYQTEGPRLYKTLGCFRDNWSRAIPTLEGRDAILDGGYQQRQDPTLKCYQAANRRRYKVFAVQNGGWCASSATAGETYDKYGPSSNCASDGEGGGWANQVYEIQGIPLKRHVLTNSSRKCLCLIN